MRAVRFKEFSDILGKMTHFNFFILRDVIIDMDSSWYFVFIKVKKSEK